MVERNEQNGGPPVPSDGGDPGREDDVHGVPDATLGGYIDVHDRPPAFDGADGQPYSVSMEIEQTGDLRRPWLGYLVFPRWAETGLGIVGHVQTPVLATGNRSVVEESILGLSLDRVKGLLDEAIRRREADEEVGDVP